MPFTFKLSQRLARMRRTALVLTAALAACEKPVQLTDPINTVAQVVVSPRAVTVPTNQMVDFMAVALTTTGDTVPLAVSWSVTSGSVTDTSTSGGRHYGHYKAGSDTGKVKVIAHGNPGGSTDTAVVTVTPVPVSAVTINPASASVLVGQTAQLAATTFDSAGNVLTGRTVTWASSNSSVGLVNGSGLVTSVAAGSTTINAVSEGRSGTASISVSNVLVASVAVSPATASLTVGGTQQLIATPKDANGNPLTGRTISWTNSNSGVATVNGSGLVGASAAGSATITATSEGQSGTASISVSNVPVTSVAVSPATASLTVGGTQQLIATPKDANGNPLTGRTISWTSSNSGVATVNGSGLVGASATGSATITATSEGQSGTASISVSNVPVASVAVSPATASLTVGGTQQFIATPKDANGNALIGRTITWTSSNSGVGTVNGTGLVGASAAGSATITAMSEGQSGTATVTVTAPPPPTSAPSAVTDLTVAGTTDSSVTLSFTEVNDGTGNPAGYDVRYAAGTISWGSATEVSRGTCATPMAGTTIGARRTCTVVGLSASTAYGFQLIAFRGTLNVNAVFGGLSNVASGTTAAGAPQPVASVVVSPTTASVGVGGTQQFTATLRDASGNVLTGRATSWTSSVQSIATVSAGGLVTALLAGTTTITATSEGQSGTATMTVTVLPPPSTGWPHEPAGYRVITDYDMHALNDGGWLNSYPSQLGSGISLASVAGAPASAPTVWQFAYPAGYSGGSAPGTEYYPISAPYPTALYVGFWWKPSNPWQGHSSGVNKLMFVYAGGPPAGLIIKMLGTGSGPFRTQVTTEFGTTTNWNENVGSSSPLALGQWHRVEMFLNYAGGVLQWWVDGVLVGSYTGIGYPNSGFNQLEFSPTWGGVGDTKSETDYYWYDQIRASRP